MGVQSRRCTYTRKREDKTHPRSGLFCLLCASHWHLTFGRQDCQDKSQMTLVLFQLFPSCWIGTQFVAGGAEVHSGASENQLRCCKIRTKTQKLWKRHAGHAFLTNLTSFDLRWSPLHCTISLLAQILKKVKAILRIRLTTWQGETLSKTSPLLSSFDRRSLPGAGPLTSQNQKVKLVISIY